MDDCRSEGSVSGEPGEFAAVSEAASANQSRGAGRHNAHEGDVIHGLRSGLVFSLAIWAVLLTVGALLFA
jgi:hypothetical protein